MKKIRLTLSLLLVFALLSLALISCGAKEYAKNDMAVEESQGIFTESVSDSLTDSSGILANDDVETMPTADNAKSDLSQRKIIETVSLTVQTKAFDALMQDLEAKIAELGGYVESSEAWGNSMDSHRNRSAHLTVRIPAKESGKFTGFVSENAVVTNRNVSTDDVTLSYVDMESRVSALEAEKTALENILKNAVTVEDVLKIRSSLTDVIYEIESLKSKLRTYDNLIDYTKITLSIHEVERTTVVEEQSIWQEIGTNLKNNTDDVLDFFVELFVFLASSLPFLIPLSIILVIAFLILRKKKKAKKQNISSDPDDSSK